MNLGANPAYKHHTPLFPFRRKGPYLLRSVPRFLAEGRRVQYTTDWWDVYGLGTIPHISWILLQYEDIDRN